MIVSRDNSRYRDIVDSSKIECHLSTTLVLFVFLRVELVSILGKYKRH